MSVNIIKMDETEFKNHALSELYKKLADYRSIYNLTKLYIDDASENAIKDYLVDDIRQGDDLENILKNVKNFLY